MSWFLRLAAVSLHKPNNILNKRFAERESRVTVVDMVKKIDTKSEIGS